METELGVLDLDAAVAGEGQFVGRCLLRPRGAREANGAALGVEPERPVGPRTLLRARDARERGAAQPGRRHLVDESPGHDRRDGHDGGDDTAPEG